MCVKHIKLTKTRVARIAQVLTVTKMQNPNAMTPMAMTVNDVTDFGKTSDAEEVREEYLRVARYLGWPVMKRGGSVYENGMKIWGTDGR